ncbi:hypothetical protein BC835DRAFT_307840 [Cytidiella melzeri]|nr:hypothetical protein BC835DRAFT_307840 [Cytidiella melzeri]
MTIGENTLRHVPIRRVRESRLLYLTHPQHTLSALSAVTMLDFNGIQVWVSCPDGTDVHATAQTQQRDYESVATIAYGRRREFTLHWHTMDSPIPYSALFVVYVKNDKTSREKKAAVIFLKKGWTDSRTQKSNLEKEFRDGLRFPYTPRSKENQNQIEGSVRLEVYQNPRIPATKHVLKLDDYLQHLNKPFAVFRFNFVFGCNESFADDESSSDFEADR